MQNDNSTTQKQIKVQIVDDSAIIRAILKQILNNDSRFLIAGEAANGEAAIQTAKQVNPDLIIMDINMPVLNGIEATKAIMKEAPTAIVLFSTEDSARYSFEGINAGAVEMIEKPDLSSSSSSFFNQFKERLYSIGSQNKRISIPKKKEVSTPIKINSESPVILIGASTGGPMAVQTVLKGLGKNIPAPILLTQHIDVTFAKHYTPWLAETTGLAISFGTDGEVCQNGHVYVAPPDYHMTVSQNCGKYIINLNQEESVHFLRPAVDPMFASAAKNIGKNSIAILLTGMGRDGADGCKLLKNTGAFTICESEETCAVYGMPKAAIEEGGASLVLPLDEIGDYVKQMITSQNL
ncbi:MAG: chemotaxis-specific protein-glutamate methyltransferase CheB [Treponema sp.]|nr:chemotaxis-specific protein-glutamate methyltransferase CheB [Treponema sp.]